MKEPYPETPELFDEEGDSMAFAYGLKDGFLRLKPLPSRYKSAAANEYYYYPGFIISYTLKIVLLILIAHFGVQ